MAHYGKDPYGPLSAPEGCIHRYIYIYIYILYIADYDTSTARLLKKLANVPTVSFQPNVDAKYPPKERSSK